MAINETVNIKVTSQGIEQVDRQVKGLGQSALGLKSALLGVATALGAVVAVRGLAGLAADAVKTSAAFESYGVTLRALLGSQQEANTALDNFTTLAAKTPFAVGEVVQGATSLAAAALGNREKLEELTQTAANLAAVTGLSFQEAAGNLSRALAAGIGAADLFRDRGVRALIESIKGIPDATKLTTTELNAAFRDVFGEFGTFGDAAENLSLTLGGALSNIGDSAETFKRELGDALSPVVVNAARQLLIPFFENLRTLVTENADAIRSFVAGALSALIRGFILAGETGLSFAAGLADARQFVITLTGSLFEAQLSVAEFDLALNRLANSIGLVSDQDLAFQQEEVDLLAAGVDAVAEDVGRAAAETDKFKTGLDALGESLRTLKDLASTTNLAAAVAAPTGGPSTEALGGGVDRDALLAAEKERIAAEKAAKKAAAEEARRLKREEAEAEREALRLLQEQAAAREALLGVIRDQRFAEAEKRGDLEAQRFLIDEQIAQATELARISGEQALGEQAINQLIADRAALGQGGFGAGLSEGLSEGLRTAFQSANKDGLDFAETLGNALQAQANQALFDGFDESLSALEGVLDETFTAVAAKLPDTFKGAFGSLGDSFGNALGQGLQFLALQGLGALLGGGGGNASSSSTGNITSAVTSTQAVRGIVAGPQQIAIANVGRNIAEANEPVVAELRIQTSVLRTIASLLQTAGGAGFDADAMALATGSAPATAI